MKTIRQIQCDAATLLRTNGWLQGMLGSKGRAHCLVGACVEAAGLDENPDRFDESPEVELALAAAADAAGVAISHLTTAEAKYQSVYRWNDGLNAIGGAEHVIEALEAACAKETP